MKLRQLVSSIDAFNRIVNKEWPAKVSLNLKKLIRQINIELEDYNKVRIELAETLGKRNEKTSSYDFEVEENRVEFNKQMESLLNEEIELKFHTIPIQVLETNNIKILPVDLVVLDWLIVEDKEQEPRE